MGHGKHTRAYTSGDIDLTKMRVNTYVLRKVCDRNHHFGVLNIVLH